VISEVLDWARNARGGRPYSFTLPPGFVRLAGPEAFRRPEVLRGGITKPLRLSLGDGSQRGVTDWGDPPFNGFA